MKVMGMGMFRKLFDGLLFGTGFSIAVIGVGYLAYGLFMPDPPGYRDRDLSASESTVSTAPEISRAEGFLDSTEVYSGDFSHDGRILAAGDGVLTGKASLNGNPVVGFKFRLLLNGSVKSQWTTTDQEGRYAVSLPYGDYRVDGYEFNSHSTNTLHCRCDH